MGELVHPDFAANRRVVLAREAGFSVGRLEVHPSTRQISSGKSNETVEPRVLQVLVVLARANGEVVSKDELIHCCWEGRIVGEDAINRVVSKIRHIAQDIGGGSFHIDTIRGVGYRLVEGMPSPGPAAVDRGAPADTRPAIPRRSLLIGSAVAAAAIAGGGIWISRPWTREPAPLALQYYRQGLSTRAQNSPELTERGAALFRQATRIDPQFADAWGALAWTYRDLAESGGRGDVEHFRSLARSAAYRALELDRENADAQAALLLLKPNYRNWAAIDAGCRRLLAEHPGHSSLEYNLGVNLGEVGRWRDAIPYFRSVSEREKFWILPHIDWCHALAFSGRLDEAGDLIDDGIRRFPGHPGYWLTKVRFLALTGRGKEAFAFATDAESLPAGTSIPGPQVQLEIALSKAFADGSQESRAAAARAFTEIASKYPSRTGFAATALVLLGQLDSAFSMFAGYFLGEGPWARGQSKRAATSRLFGIPSSDFHRDPRFAQLLQRTGLEDYWRATGTAPDYRRFPMPQYRFPIGQSSG